MKISNFLKIQIRTMVALGLALAPSFSVASISTGAIERGPASINRAAIAIAKPSRIFFGEDGKSLSPELIADFYNVKATEKPLDIAQYIPTDMKPSNDQSEVMSQVADKSMTAFFNSEAVRQTSFGKAATDVEKKLKKEVVIGGGDPKAIQHKINFNVQAFQALAQVQYDGFTHAAVKYYLAQSKVGVEVSEKLIGNKDLVLSHTAGPQGRTSDLSVRWTF